MAIASSSIDVRSLAVSVGLVIDRTVDGQGTLGNVWVIERKMVATCAHLVYGYRNFLPALKVKFPGTDTEFGVESCMFHPGFDLKLASQMAQVAVTEPVSSFPLQLNNAVVLKLSDSLPSLTDDMTIRVNRTLSVPAPPREQGLGGNLGEIDLAMVLQTITNARKEGIITICDDRNFPIARIFCQDGRVMYAHYRNLTNEMALYQIFNKDLRGNFFFWGAPKPNWNVTHSITRPADMVLIESHRRLDELKNLMMTVGPREALFVRKQEQPNLEVLPGEVKDYANLLWSLLDGGTPIGQLWQVANIDDFAIYTTVSELIKTGQVQRFQVDPRVSQSGALAAIHSEPPPLVMSVNAALAPWDSISNVNRDPEIATALVRSGSLLGLLKEDDPWHLLHNIRLVPEAAGSPIIKDGRVIGMHCGALAADAAAGQQQGSFQEMLWVDAVVECLKGGGEGALASKLTLIDAPPKPSLDDAGPESKVVHPTSGCREVAHVDCAKCGRTSLKSARFCRSCGQRLIKDSEPTMIAPVPMETPGLPVVPILLSVILFLGLGAGIYFAISNGLISPGADTKIIDTAPVVVEDTTTPQPVKPEETPVESFTIPAQEAVDFKIYQHFLQTDTEKKEHIAWEAQPESRDFQDGDRIYLELTASRPSHVYLLYNGTSDPEGTASLIYPLSDVDDKELGKGDSLTIPSNIREMIDGDTGYELALQIHPPAGAERLLVIASPDKLNLVGDNQLVNRVYRIAVDMLETVSNSQSVEASRSEFPKELFVKDDKNSDNMGSEAAAEGKIYLGRHLIRHSREGAEK